MQAMRICVVGSGPAGLRAAEVAAERGAEVTVFEAKRSVGRKLLVAGRSGLNLTHDESFESFLGRYSGDDLPIDRWRQWLHEFDSATLRRWAADLGVETFVSGSGKVLPLPVNGQMKATPLLRHWIARLAKLGVHIRTNQRWIGFDADKQMLFEHGGECTTQAWDAVILALGGGSWPKCGSDGSWTSILEAAGIRVAPLRASNCGWETSWPADLLRQAEGLPLKNLQVHAGDQARSGELTITRYGLEGGPLYALGPTLRTMPDPGIAIDFKPHQSKADLLRRMGNVQRNFTREAFRRLNLDPGTRAILKYMPGRGPWTSSEQVTAELKHCRIELSGPRPLREAISSAGGIAWTEFDENLMLKRLPGVYAAGEMIDWDAPTGGYLLHACLATGTLAGRAAARNPK